MILRNLLGKFSCSEPSLWLLGSGESWILDHRSMGGSHAGPLHEDPGNQRRADLWEALEAGLQDSSKGE